MHRIGGVLPVPHMCGYVTCAGYVTCGLRYVRAMRFPPIDILIRFLAAEHRDTAGHLLNFIPISVSLWNERGGPAFDGVGLSSFKDMWPMPVILTETGTAGLIFFVYFFFR